MSLNFARLQVVTRNLYHLRGRGTGASGECQAARVRSTLASTHHSPLPPTTPDPILAEDEPVLPGFDKDKPLIYTQPPNPLWKPGQRSQNEKCDVKRKRWNMGDTAPRDAYKLMTSAIVPRPIAFVSTISSDGIPNLAPFSYFSMVSHNPPMISVSFSLSKRRPKDTRENILSTKQFTVNMISESFVEAANATSVESPATTDEWILSGLTPEPSIAVKPSLVQESAINLECELYSFQDICAPNSSRIATTVVLGLIKHIHVREDVLDESGETVDPSKLKPVSRLGGIRYGRLTDAFELPRIDWSHLGGLYNGLLG